VRRSLRLFPRTALLHRSRRLTSDLSTGENKDIALQNGRHILLVQADNEVMRAGLVRYNSFDRHRNDY
jgi:hypothetical protein